VKLAFLDTGYVIALETSDDQHHGEAREHWRSFSAALPPLVTTSYVFDEVVTFFTSRGRHAKAVEVGTRLLESPSVELIQVDEELFRAGWEYLKQRPDKRYSLTDSISFVLMQQRGIAQALAFDAHFVQAGFSILPGRRG
jgi:predicted nucleic acid-binding protein